MIDFLVILLVSHTYHILLIIVVTTSTYTSIISSKLNVENALIIGKGKNLSYVPGETFYDDILPGVWNSFRCGGKWHLVYTDLAVSTVKGFHRGGELVLEEDGNRPFRAIASARGFDTAQFTDFWFCTNPAILAVHAHPFDAEFQYLPDAIKYHDDKFEQCAYVQPGFFQAGLSLLSENSWVLLSRNGRCTITLGCQKSVLRSLRFKYRLSFVQSSGDIAEEQIQKMPRMVLYAPGIDDVSFTVSLPVRGEYSFSTTVNSPDLGTRYAECFEFRIHCDEPDSHCLNLPREVESLGVGYTHVARDFGLKHPSKTTPTINVQQGQATRTLQIAEDRIDDVEFTSDVIGDDTQSCTFLVLKSQIKNNCLFVYLS